MENLKKKKKMSVCGNHSSPLQTMWAALAMCPPALSPDMLHTYTLLKTSLQLVIQRNQTSVTHM